MSIILKAENISKQYRLGLVGTGSILHDFNRFWYRIRGKEDPYLKIGAVNDRTAKATEDYVWALQDINFEVQQGEVLGIIGKNGAGKSTLLKLLSQVTSPTTGVIKSKGRIASLLEVGTGFHPELTGRENIYLNGAILGMTKAEIASKIDEIIEFSGCELYIDTPTKRYSSGMTVRLAFAVAAHLEPDILVIDEVLAVGDAEFQKRAIGKMQEISSGQGRTVLFVSHNMASVQKLCNRILLIEHGKVILDTLDVDEGIQRYLQTGRDQLKAKLNERTDRKGNGFIKLMRVGIEDASGNEVDTVITGSKVVIKFECQKKEGELKKVAIAFSVTRSNGTLLSTFVSDVTHDLFNLSESNSEVSFSCVIDRLPFSEGTYDCNVTIKQDNQVTDWVIKAFGFTVIDGDYFGTGRINPKSHSGVLIDHHWSKN
ncbi:MAG: ABC transporter ATP-binding protein [Bacteroidota bacterium]